MKVFGLGIITLMIVSCSGKNDPMNALEDYVEEQYALVIESGFKLSDIEKTNGIKGEFNGVERYRIEYKATFKSTFEGYMQVGEFTEHQKPSDAIPEHDVKPELYNLFATDTIQINDKFQVDGYVVGDYKGQEHRSYDYENSTYVKAYFLFKPMKKGIEVTKQGRETLTKTDNGWQVE